VTEASLKRGLVAAIKDAMPGAVVFRHEDKFTGGIPDLSVTWNGRTVWIEVKRAGEPVTALQRVTLARIRAQRVPAFLLRYWGTSVRCVDVLVAEGRVTRLAGPTFPDVHRTLTAWLLGSWRGV
jgi:hypothetical protein